MVFRAVWKSALGRNDFNKTGRLNVFFLLEIIQKPLPKQCYFLQNHIYYEFTSGLLKPSRPVSFSLWLTQERWKEVVHENQYWQVGYTSFCNKVWKRSLEPCGILSGTRPNCTLSHTQMTRKVHFRGFQTVN